VVSASSPEASDAGPVVPAVYFAALFAATALALGHEVLVRQLAAYLDPGFGPARAAVAGAGVAALLLGFAAARRIHAPRQSLGWLLVALSVLAPAAPFLLFWSFARSGFSVAAFAVPLVVGAVLGAALETARSALGQTVLRLGAVEYLLNPFRLLGLGVAFGGAAVAAALIGVLRTGAAIGITLAVLALWTATLLEYLERVKVAHAGRQRAAAGAAFVLGLAALAGAERAVPLRDQAFFEADVVYAEAGPDRRLSVISSQDSFEVFSGHSLRYTTLDQHRYFEALVRPALAAVAAPRRVLVIGSGDGLVEREALKHPAVEQVTLLVADRSLFDLGRRMPWLVALNEGALGSPRVTLIEAEPLVYLETPRAPFDVALIDLPDPEGYAEGKYYTRYFFELIARNLRPGGVVGVQTTSAFTTPRCAGSVVATLRAAGYEVLPYRAPLATLGEWGFALAARDRLPRPQRLTPGRFVTAEVFEAAQPARDARPAADAPPSLLYDQNAVTLFEQEIGAVAP
jgi:spermidine synthase